jgi:hypothetical protein
MVEASKRWQRGEGSGFGRVRGRAEKDYVEAVIELLQALAELTSTPLREL